MRQSWIAAGVVLGAVGAVATLLATADVAPSRAPGAAVRLIAGPTGELAVTPVGAFLVADDLRADDTPATGTLDVKNQTAHPVRLRIDARPTSPDLDDSLVVDVVDAEDGSVVLAPERLGLLHEQATTVVLGSGEHRSLRVAVRVAAGASGFEGAVVDVPLVIDTVQADA